MGTTYTPRNIQLPEADAWARRALERGKMVALLQRRLWRTRQMHRRLRAVLRDEQALRERLSQLLTETAAALKGEPADNKMHDWSNLPLVARLLREDLERLAPSAPGRR
jgi:hypothetical protein